MFKITTALLSIYLCIPSFAQDVAPQPVIIDAAPTILQPTTNGGFESEGIVVENIVSSDQPIQVIPAEALHEPSQAESEPTSAGDENPNRCVPNFVDQQTLVVADKTAIFLTHFTKRLDKNQMTRPALGLIVKGAKSRGLPVFYLHERHEDPAKYFYDDCTPSAYIDSDIGFFQFKSHDVKHAIVAGGFYELCLHNTVTQIIDNWLSNEPRQDLKITYVTDAVYCVASDSRTEDWFNTKLRKWIASEPHTTVQLHSVVRQISHFDQELIFLSRRLNALPEDIGVHVEHRGGKHLVRDPKEGKPTVVFSYKTSRQLTEDWTRSQSDEPSQPSP